MAIVYQTPGSVAYSAGGGTSVDVGYPASASDGEKLLLIIGQKPATANGGSVTTPTDWILVTSITGAGGFGTDLTADQGNTNLYVYERTVPAGGLSGTLTVSLSDNNVAWGVMLRLTADSGWGSLSAATGSDETGDYDVSVTCSSNPAMTSGDLVVAAFCCPTDAVTSYGSYAISQSGVTYGSAAESAFAKTGNGYDICGFVCYAAVSSGSSTGAPTLAATINTGSSPQYMRGPGVVVRIREGSSGEPGNAYATGYGVVAVAGSAIAVIPLVGEAIVTGSAAVATAGQAQGLHVFEVVGYCHLDYVMASGEVLAATDLDWHGFIQGVTELTLPITTEVLRSVALVYGLAWEIVGYCDLLYSVEQEIIQAVHLDYGAVTPVLQAVDLLYNLETMTPVLQAVELIHLTAQEGETIELSQILEVGGVLLSSVTSLNLSRSREQYFISATIDLADGGEYNRCRLGTAATLTLMDVAVALVVVGRSRPRSPEEYRYQVSLASPAALLDSPWAETISGDYQGMASAIAAEIAGVIAWNTVDWPILAGRLLISGQAPLAVLRQLSGAVGAVLVSEWDGGITAEPEYPLSLPVWPTATPAYTISEVRDVFTADESEAPEDYFNAVVVGDGQADGAAAGGIVMEIVEAEDGDGKMVRAWCSPWNPSLVASHAGGGWVQLSLEGEQIREESEVVTITSGEGNCRYPVESVVRSDWRESDLGEVTVEADGRITAASSGDSLLDITYRTRAIVWRLRDPREEGVLVVVEGDDALGGFGGISVEVVRGLGDSYGPEVQDSLLCSDLSARERGRNLIDGACSPRATESLTCPFRGLLRPGGLVEVLDIERPRWRGLLTGQSVTIALQGEELTAESVFTIEREVDAA